MPSLPGQHPDVKRSDTPSSHNSETADAPLNFDAYPWCHVYVEEGTLYPREKYERMIRAAIGNPPDMNYAERLAEAFVRGRRVRAAQAETR